MKLFTCLFNEHFEAYKVSDFPVSVSDNSTWHKGTIIFHSTINYLPKAAQDEYDDGWIYLKGDLLDVSENPITVFGGCITLSDEDVAYDNINWIDPDCAERLIEKIKKLI